MRPFIFNKSCLLVCECVCMGVSVAGEKERECGEGAIENVYCLASRHKIQTTIN